MPTERLQQSSTLLNSASWTLKVRKFSNKEIPVLEGLLVGFLDTYFRDSTIPHLHNFLLQAQLRPSTSGPYVRQLPIGSL